MKRSNLGPPIPGKPHGGEPEREQEHFYTCPTCGQRVDMRDLRLVMWHEQPGHQPLDEGGARPARLAARRQRPSRR